MQDGVRRGCRGNDLEGKLLGNTDNIMDIEHPHS